MRRRLLLSVILVLLLLSMFLLVACDKQNDVDNVSYADKLLTVHSMADLGIYLGNDNMLPNQEDTQGSYICHKSKPIGKLDIKPDKALAGIKYAVISAQYKGVAMVVYTYKLSLNIGEKSPTMPNAIEINERIAAMELIDEEYNKLVYSFYDKDMLYVVIDIGLRQMPLLQDWEFKKARAQTVREFIARFE